MIGVFCCHRDGWNKAPFNSLKGTLQCNYTKKRREGEEEEEEEEEVEEEVEEEKVEEEEEKVE